MKTKNLTIRLSQFDLDMLTAIAAKHQRTLSGMVLDLILDKAVQTGDFQILRDKIMENY